MTPLAIEGTTRRIGKSQGYKGLCILDTMMPDGVTPVMVTSWEPTPAEIQRIVSGAPVRLYVLGISHPPVMLEV